MVVVCQMAKTPLETVTIPEYAGECRVTFMEPWDGSASVAFTEFK